MGEEKNQVFKNREVKQMGVKSGERIQKDVKNEATSGDVHENKGRVTKCTPINPAFRTKIQRLSGQQQEYVGLLRPKCRNYAAIRGKDGAFSACLSPFVLLLGLTLALHARGSALETPSYWYRTTPAVLGARGIPRVISAPCVVYSYWLEREEEQKHV